MNVILADLRLVRSQSSTLTSIQCSNIVGPGREEFMRRERDSFMSDFKMEMIAGSSPALSYSSNSFSLAHMLTKSYQIVMVMRINSNHLYLMLKDHNTSIPTRPPAAKNDLSICCGVYGSSSGRDDINPIVPTRGILFETTRNLTLHRPNQCHPFQGYFLSSDCGVSRFSGGWSLCRAENL